MTIDYFMYRCTLWEVNTIVSNIPYLDRNGWEQTRLLAYIDGKSHFKGIKKQKDIMSLPWDDGDIEQVQDDWLTKEISNEDIFRLKELARQEFKPTNDTINLDFQ